MTAHYLYSLDELQTIYGLFNAMIYAQILILGHFNHYYLYL